MHFWSDQSIQHTEFLINSLFLTFFHHSGNPGHQNGISMVVFFYKLKKKENKRDFLEYSFIGALLFRITAGEQKDDAKFR
jgi:hypothetical protein